MGVMNLLTKTNFDFLTTGKYLPILSAKIGKIVINFWCTDKEFEGFVARIIWGTQGDSEGTRRFSIVIEKMMASIQLAENYDKKFRYIDIVFHPEFQNVYISQFFENSPHIGTLGYVTQKDIEEDRNIVHLNISETQFSSMDKNYKELVEKLKTEGYVEKEAIKKIDSMEKELELQCENNFMTSLSQTLVHELTHLWQIKQSKSLELQKRMQTLFYAFIKPGEKYDTFEFLEYIKTIFNNIKSRECSLEDMNKLIEILKKFYLILREKFEEFRYSLIVEGVAVFNEKYINGLYDYDEINSVAEQGVKMLCLDFHNMIVSFINIVEMLKFKVSSGETESKKSLVEAYDENFKHICDFYDRFAKYSYIIGPIIPATFFEYGMQIKEIGLLNEREYISKYEEICVSKGIRPLISDSILSESNAVFNIAEAGAQFNALRKKLGITSLPQK